MEDLQGNSSQPPPCRCLPEQALIVSLVDILTFLIGQPVIFGLLWISFMSNKTPDILNTNLGLFHGLQYLMSLVHFVFIYALPDEQTGFLRFMFVFAQFGGPTGLSFICIQRYVAVVYPASYPLLRKYKYCEVCAVAVWIISVPTAIGSFFFTTVPSFKAKMMKDVPIFLMVGMILMMWQCSLRIMVMLRRRGPGKGKLHPAKKRAFKTIAATTAITMVFYIPVALLQKFRSDNQCDYECETTPRCVFLLSAASVVHPLFYLYTQRKLLTCFKQLKKTR